MTEQTNEELQKVDATNDIIKDQQEIINNIRSSTVEKAEYDKMREQNKALMKQLTENRAITPAVEAPKPNYQKDFDESLKVLTDASHYTNLQYAEANIKFRDACIALKGVDPFTDELVKQKKGGVQKYKPTQEDINRANEDYNELKAVVEKSNGSPERFNQIMTQLLIYGTDLEDIV